MHGDHIARGPADRLSRDHGLGAGRADGRARGELELGEHDVRDRVRPCDERTQGTDERGEQRPGVAHGTGGRLGEGDRHRIQAGAVVVGTGVDEHTHQRQRTQQRHGRTGDLRTGDLPRAGDLLLRHPVDEVGQSAGEDEDRAGRPQQIHVLTDGSAEDVVDLDHCRTVEELLDRRHIARDEQQRDDNEIRRPGADQRHLLLQLRLLLARVHGAHPERRPLLSRGEVPGLLRHEEAHPRGRHDDGQTDEPTEQRRELGAEDVRHDEVGNDHRQGRIDGERSDGQTVGEAPVGTEESGHQARQQQWDEDAAAGVDERNLSRGVRDELRLVESELTGALGDIGRHRPVLLRQSRADAQNHRSAHGAEAHRRRLDDETREHRGDRREAEGEHERGDDGGRSAETGGTLDEGTEEPGDDDDLHAPIRRDRDEAGADGLDRPGPRDRGQQQQCAEDDPQQADRDEETLDDGGADRHPLDLPREVRHEGGGDQPDGHGIFGRPAEADEQDSRQQDGGQGQESCNSEVVHFSVRSAAPLPRRSTKDVPSFIFSSPRRRVNENTVSNQG